jgi:hypothetical protein
MCWCKTWLSNIHLLFTIIIIISSWNKILKQKCMWGGHPWYQGIDVLLWVMFIAWGWLSDPVLWLFFFCFGYTFCLNSHYCKSLGELLRLEIRLFSFWQSDYIIIHYDRMLKDGFASFLLLYWYDSEITAEGRRITKLDQILLNGNNIAIVSKSYLWRIFTKPIRD